MAESYALQFSDRALTSLKRLDKPSAQRIHLILIEGIGHRSEIYDE
jgi:hypothetical protein